MYRVNILNNLKEVILDFMEWYKTSTLRQQRNTMLISGGIMGLISGRIMRHYDTKEGKHSKNYEMSFYSLNNIPTNYNLANINHTTSDDSKENDPNEPKTLTHNEILFERTWNKMSQLAQKQPGYKYTKLYKAKYLKESPVHYFNIRLWRNKKDLENYRNLEEYKHLEKDLQQCVSEIMVKDSKVIIDDSVRREIPYKYDWF